MISFEEAGRILDEAAEALPEEIFRGLNGGVNLIPQVRRDENGLLVMGTYNVDQMGRRVEIYYGSFRVRYPDASPDKCAKALVRTLKHELRHHIENLAMDRSLERWDEQHVAELLSGLYDIERLEVRSLLFADDEASGVAEMACSMFQSAAKGVGIDVVSGCACNEVGAISIRAARASLDRYGVRATACGRPVPLTRELCEQFAVRTPLPVTFSEIGLGTLIHNDPTDRPPEIFDRDVTLHFDPDNAPYLQIPVIPART